MSQIKEAAEELIDKVCCQGVQNDVFFKLIRHSEFLGHT